uniref:Uncharacterized protein n=1 Tax=Dechloromonas aromatica (strain RCB) TaxID=159087 RepID=Q47CM0_DECAR
MKNDDWRLDWVKQKCTLALHIGSSFPEAGYGEAALIICAVLSAMSAELWPGNDRIDRSRFCELLIRYSDRIYGADTISVPLLIQFLNNNERAGEATKLEQLIKHRESPLVVTGDEVDVSEAQVIEVCPALRIEEARRFSYANLLYREVRSSYAHEYWPGTSSCQWPMTSKQGAHVSYVNRLVDEKERLTQIRLIHFHIEWLAALAISIAENLSGKPTPVSRPNQWWIAGGG